MMKVAIVVLAVLTASCSPMIGDQCTGELACASANAGLFCESGKLLQYDCPGGCFTNAQAKTAECKFTGVTDGTLCPNRNEGQAICDGTALVKCSNSVWRKTECKKGCAMTGNAVACNPQDPVAGDKCTGEIFCNGATTGLFCENTVFTQYKCPGGCATNTAAGTAVCSFKGIVDGDQCPARALNTADCDSADFLQCKSDSDAGTDPRWRRKSCPGGCQIMNNRVYCNP